MLGTVYTWYMATLIPVNNRFKAKVSIHWIIIHYYFCFLSFLFFLLHCHCLFFFSMSVYWGNSVVISPCVITTHLTENECLTWTADDRDRNHEVRGLGGVCEGCNEGSEARPGGGVCVPHQKACTASGEYCGEGTTHGHHQAAAWQVEHCCWASWHTQTKLRKSELRGKK